MHHIDPFKEKIITPDTYKYFAFISYSRKDSKAAKWLQRRLEWFRFPVKMVAQESRPLHPKYIRPVYRDKTNLEVDAAHYWENIKGAISQSRFLIVLCSPDSASSQPVDKEILHFLSDSKREDVLADIVPVILKGNVGSQDDSECLSPALLEQGSKVMDRNLPTMVPDGDDSEKDGWENGFIGVASYLLQLKRESLSDHCQREERKRARRARLLSAVFALLAIMAVAGGILAWHQRGKAISAEKTAIEQRSKAVFNLSQAHIDQARSAGQNGDLLLAAQAAMAGYSVADHPASRMAVWEYLQTLPMEQDAFINPGIDRGTLCLLSDGTLIISSGKEVTAWDGSGKKISAWPLVGTDVVGITGSGGGNIWVLTLDGQIFLCTRGGGLSRVADLNERCASLALSGTRLAVGTADGEVYLFDIGADVLIAARKLPLAEAFTKALYVALSHDGKILYVSHNAPGPQGIVAAMDLNSGKYLWKQPAERPARLALSRENRFLAWYNMTGDISVVDSKSGRLVQKAHVNGTFMGWMGFNSDSRELSYAYQIPNREDSVVDILDVATGKMRRIYEGIGTLATALFVSQNRLLVSGLNRGFWVDISPSRRHFQTDEMIWRIRTSGSGTYLMCAGRPNWLDAMAGEMNQRLTLRTVGVPHEMWPFIRGRGSIVRVDSELKSESIHLKGAVTCSDILPDGSMMTGNAKGELFHLKDGERRLLTNFNSALRYLHAGHGNILVYGFKEIGKGDGVLRFNERGELQTLDILEQDINSITASVFIPDTRQIVVSRGAWAVGSDDSSLLLLDSDAEVVLSQVRLNAGGVIRDLAVVSAGRQLAAALSTGEVALFSLPDLGLLHRFPISSEPVFRLADIPGKKGLLAAGDGKGSVHLVDFKNGESLYHTQAAGAPVTAMTLTNDTWWVAFDNRLERWRNVMDADRINEYAGQVRYHSIAGLRQSAVKADAKGEFEKALELWERLSRYQPKDIVPLKQTLLLHKKLGQYDAAVRTIDRILAIIKSQILDIGGHMDLYAFVLQKGQVLYEKWQHTKDQDDLNASLDIFLDVFIQMPREPTVHIALLSMMLADGQSDLCVQAAQALLLELSRHNRDMGALPLDIVNAGILCAARSRVSASYFQNMLPKLLVQANINLPRSVKETWLGTSNGSGIDWEALPPRDGAKLRFLLAQRCLSSCRKDEARFYFEAGIRLGDWHSMNRRGLDELDGKKVRHHVPDDYTALYRLLLTFHGSLIEEAPDERYKALVQLTKQWAPFIADASLGPLYLKGWAKLHQASGEASAALGNTAQAMGHLKKAAAAWQKLFATTQAPADQTAAIEVLGNLCWMELLYSDRETALAHCRQSVSQLLDARPHPSRLNLAHACLLNGRFEEAAEIYKRYAGQTFSDGRKWNDELRNDFKILKQHNKGHPDMEEIEEAL